MKKFILVILVYLLFFFWRFSSLRRTSSPAGIYVEIVGQLKEEPEISGTIQRFSLGGFRIKTRRLPSYHYGDNLKIVGKVGKYQTIAFPIIIKLNNSESSGFLALLLRFRRKMEEVINQNLPFPQSSLLIGMLLGIKNLPPALSADLKRSGLIHLVVASGSNITLVSAYPLYLSPLIGRKKALFLSLLSILLYALMVGFSPPVVRAGLMGGFSYLANFFGREALSLLTLFLSAGLMLLYNPFYLFDLSFQLSFLATAGIVLFSSVFLRIFNRFWQGLTSVLITTFSAQLFVLPLIINKFGQFSPFSLLTNLLVYPIVEPVMILGFPLAFFGVFFHLIARVFSFFLYFPLTYFLLVAHFFARPLFVCSIPKIPFHFFLPYYLFLIIFWQFLHQKTLHLNTRSYV